MLISTNTGLRSARIGKPRIKMPEAIQSLAKAGFEAVDVNFYCTTVQEPLEHEPVLDGDWKSNLHELMEQIRGNNLKISSSHTAFHKYLDKNDPEYEWYNKARILSIEASAYIRAGWAVIHPFTDENGTDTKRTIEELKPCAEAAAKWGVGLAVENMFSTDAAQLCEIADALDIGVCWDTGHANIKKLDQAAEIRMLGDRLKVLHLHDNYGDSDQHNAPLFGTVQWQQIMKALRDTGFSGDFNYEINVKRFPEEVWFGIAGYLVEFAKYMIRLE
jgi:sugar phosphate isomerase/epimerase